MEKCNNLKEENLWNSLQLLIVLHKIFVVDKGTLSAEQMIKSVLVGL